MKKPPKFPDKKKQAAKLVPHEKPEEQSTEAADTKEALKPQGIIEVVEYESEAGKNFYRKWFKDLPAQHADKVVDAIRRMEAGNLGDHKGVGSGVFEHRIHNPAIRIYFGKDGKELVILLAGGSKTRQDRDIAKAQELWQEYRDNKK